MKLPEIYERIIDRLDAVGLTATAAAKLAGKPDAIRNMRRAIDEGRGGVSTKTIRALAPVLKCSSEYLLMGTTETDATGLSDEQTEVVRLVFQSFLQWALEDPELEGRIHDVAYQAALARIAAQYARSRQVHEAARRGDQAVTDLVRLSLEMTRDQ